MGGDCFGWGVQPRGGVKGVCWVKNKGVGVWTTRRPKRPLEHRDAFRSVFVCRSAAGTWPD